MKPEQLQLLADKGELGGLYEGIPSEVYHAGPGMNKSSLDKIAVSPKHFQGMRPMKPSASMEFGTMVHNLVLECDDWTKEYVVDQKFDGRTIAGKVDRAKFVKKAKDKKIVSRGDLDAALAMKRSVMAHPTGALLTGVSEASCYWRDPGTELLCKCRPDHLVEIDGYNVIVDLKTSRDASEYGFRKSFEQYRYWVQAPFYADGVEFATGNKVDAFYFMVVEKTAPYAVNVFKMDPEYLEAGRAEYKRLLKIYARCVGENDWPAYTPDVKILSCPKWIANQQL